MDSTCWKITARNKFVYICMCLAVAEARPVSPGAQRRRRREVFAVLGRQAGPAQHWDSAPANREAPQLSACPADRPPPATLAYGPASVKSQQPRESSRLSVAEGKVHTSHRGDPPLLHLQQDLHHHHHQPGLHNDLVSFCQHLCVVSQSLRDFCLCEHRIVKMSQSGL